MNTTDTPRVEVTEELLRALEKTAHATGNGAALWSMVANAAAGRVFGAVSAFEVGRDSAPKVGLALTPSEYIAAHIVASQPAIVLALIERIRELEASQAPLMEMALCEQDGVTLRRDQPYVFRVIDGCEKCATLAAVYT